MSSNILKASCLLIALILLTQSCATVPQVVVGAYMTPVVPGTTPLPEKVDLVNSIGIVFSGNSSGGFFLHGPYVSRQEAAAAGMNQGAASAFGGAAEISAAFGAGAGGMMIALPYLLPFFLIAGAVEGEMKGLSEEEITNLMDNAEEALGYIAVQEQLAGMVLEKGNTLEGFRFVVVEDQCLRDSGCYNRLKEEKGLQTVLKINVYYVGLQKYPEYKWLRMKAEGQCLLLDSDGAKTLETRPFSASARLHTLKEWQEGGAELMASEYYKVMDNLAQTILDVMVLQPKPSPVVSDHFCWMEPVSPSVNPNSANTFETLDSTKPEFRWSLPFGNNEEFSEVSGGDSGAGIADLQYDLRIWKPVKQPMDIPLNDPGQLVYERTDLVEPFHLLTEPLEPGVKYYWSVRARYKINGVERRTGWASIASARMRAVPIGWRTGYPRGKKKALHPEWYMDWDEWRNTPLDVLEASRCTAGYVLFNKYFRFKTGRGETRAAEPE